MQLGANDFLNSARILLNPLFNSYFFLLKADFSNGHAMPGLEISIVACGQYFLKLSNLEINEEKN